MFNFFQCSLSAKTQAFSLEIFLFGKEFHVTLLIDLKYFGYLLPVMLQKIFFTIAGSGRGIRSMRIRSYNGAVLVLVSVTNCLPIISLSTYIYSIKAKK